MDEYAIVARLAGVLRGQMSAEQATFTAQALVPVVKNIEAIAYQNGAAESAQALAETQSVTARRIDGLRGLVRDVLVDYVPMFTGDDETTDCNCSAHRARRYLLANGVEL